MSLTLWDGPFFTSYFKNNYGNSIEMTFFQLIQVFVMAYIQLNGQIFGGEKCKGKGNVEINFDYAFFSREYKNKTRHLCTPITRSISGKGSPKILSKSMLKW